MAAQKGRTKFSVRRLGRSLSAKETYSNGHLTHEAFISLAVLTAITFLGNFTQLQLSSNRAVDDISIPARYGCYGAVDRFPDTEVHDQADSAGIYGHIYCRFDTCMGRSYFCRYTFRAYT